MKGKRSIAVLSGLALGAAGYSTVIFNGASGPLAAQAQFTISGGVLTLQLTNTSTADSLVPSDLLSSVFWNMTGSPNLVGWNAVLGGGSSVYLNGVASNPANLNDFFAYRDDIAGPRAYGVSSSGFGIFGGFDLFNPGATGEPNGMGYNILSAGDNLASGNMPLMTNNLVKDSVVFTFFVGDVHESAIQDVFFQYGTSLTEPGFDGEIPPEGNPVPEPFTLAIAGAGLAMALRRRKNRR